MERVITAIEPNGLLFSEYRVHSIVLKTPKKNLDLKAALKEAVQDFIQTEKGKAIYENNGNSFTLVDASMSLPQGFCKKHGFVIIERVITDEAMDWNESLVDDRKEKAEEEVSIYKVCIEDRDSDGNVINSDVSFTTSDRDEAINVARNLRNQYGTVVIETWDAEEDNLLDTTMENQ